MLQTSSSAQMQTIVKLLGRIYPAHPPRVSAPLIQDVDLQNNKKMQMSNFNGIGFVFS